MHLRPSPNFDERPAGRAIDMLVLHYTGMPDAQAALDRLTDPATKVSTHYLIEDGGRVWRLVPEEKRAWHAGTSYWAGERDINAVSIGVELHNPGHEFGYRPFPEAQMRALEEIARDILSRHPIPRHRVLGHSDVAPARKQDPGELFDWERLARVGIGCWPPQPAPAVEPDAVGATLARIGYDVGDQRLALAAFQRHFRPLRIDGIPDDETRSRLAGLVLMREEN